MRVNFCVSLVEQGDWIRAVKPADPPVSMQRLLFVFWNVTVPEGRAAFTVSVAAVVVADPPELVNTARYLFPFCDKVVVKLSVVEVAPERLLKVAPPSVLTCHCTVGVGEPVAAAVKVAVWPAVTVWSTGCVVIVGEGELLAILKIWLAEPMQVFCSMLAPDAVEAPTTSRQPLVMLAERIS